MRTGPLCWVYSSAFYRLCWRRLGHDYGHAEQMNPSWSIQRAQMTAMYLG